MFGFLKRKQGPAPNEQLAEAVEEMRSHIRDAVAGGFDSSDQILLVARELGDDICPNAPLLQAESERLLREAVRDQLADQATWCPVTDCDRLDRAFAVLEATGIVCRQHFSCCGTCAATEIWQEISREEEKGRSIRGCAHYHEQDTEAAVSGHGVYLSYGAVEEGEDPSVAIGHEIVAALEREGLKVTWDGRLSQRIGVSLEWKRRLPAQLVELARGHGPGMAEFRPCLTATLTLS